MEIDYKPKLDPYNGDLRIKDNVEIINLNGDDLEGKRGKLWGVSSIVGPWIWIVQLNNPYFCPTLNTSVYAVTIPSVCLKRI